MRYFLQRAVYELIEKSPLLVSASHKLAAGALSLKAVSYDNVGSELDTGGVSDEVVTEVEGVDKATTETVNVKDVADKDGAAVAVDKEDETSLTVDIGKLSLVIPSDGLPSSSVTESAPKVPAEHVSFFHFYVVEKSLLICKALTLIVITERASQCRHTSYIL